MISTTTTPPSGADLTVPDVVPGWLVDEVLAGLPAPDPDETVWWWRPGLLEQPIKDVEWLRRQVRLIPAASWGSARHDRTRAFAQIVRVPGGGGFAVEVGWGGDWPSQVSFDGLPDSDSVAALTEVVRGNGAPAAVRTGRRWRLGAVAAAEVAWTWASESRLPGGYASRPAL
jgi:hypothetical protein